MTALVDIAGLHKAYGLGRGLPFSPRQRVYAVNGVSLRFQALTISWPW